MRWWELMQTLSLRNVEDSEVEAEGEVEGEDLQENDPGQGSGPPEVRGVPEDALPEFLRGRSPDEVRRAIDEAFQGARTANSELRNLKSEMDEIKSNLGKKDKEPEQPEKPLDELLYENPEEAIARVIQKRYGSRFAGLEEQVGSTVFATVRNELPDFDDYEDDVRSLLAESRAPATRANIVGAYKMVLGDRAMQQRAQASRRAANPEKPKPKPPESKKAKLSDLEKDIAKGLGVSEEKYLENRDKPMNVRVPS
jgi:hypothetical protein